tara:strand:+ start:4797 stop:7295 length:2499 start_codon:yes stop_codon:yes gene_type:complete
MTLINNSKVISTTNQKSNLAEDASGEYPRPEYYDDVSLPAEARGVARTELTVAAHSSNYTPPTEIATPSSYGQNQVSKSAGGAVWEVDDTAGNQRIIIKHHGGGGIELKPDGSILISALKGKVDITGADTTVIVGGEATLEYQGNLNMKVAGEFNIDCLDFNLTTRGNKSEKIVGSENSVVGRGSTTEITGQKTTFVTKGVTETYLGGHEHNVKGEFNHNIDGDGGFYVSGDMDISSEKDISIAAPKMVIAGDQLLIMGSNGVIGGQSVDIVGKGAVFQKGVTAPTFHGDLNGVAGTSRVTRSQTYAENVTGSAGAAITNTANDVAVNPDTSTVSAYTESEFGIRNVKIDVADKMVGYIDRSTTYSGVSSTPMNINSVRSKFRDPANKSNTKLANQLIAEGVLCPSYNNPVPPATGRVVKEEATPIISKGQIDPFNPTLAGTYVARFPDANITPEEKYNPLIRGEINASTKLNDSVTVAKFLGTDDATNLKFLRNAEAKRQLSKYLYIHGTILQRIIDNQEQFADISLQVSESVYRPGPSEVITPGSINDLKLKGRAVVYKAIDIAGKSNNNKLFDIAQYLKDTAYYEEMILSYDTYQCNLGGGVIITARLVIILPEITDDWNASFKRKISTDFNGNKFAQKEFIEIIRNSSSYLALNTTGEDESSDQYPHHGLDQTLNPKSIGYDGISNGKLYPDRMVKIANSSARKYGTGPLLLEHVTGQRWKAMKEHAKSDGIDLVPTSAYRSFYYQKRARIEHTQVNPKFTIAREGRSNHGLGVAVDIAIPGWSRGVDPSKLAVWKWLNENAAQYGFKQKSSLKFKDAVHWSRTSTGG